MAPKYQLLAVLLLIGSAFGAGYWLSPTKVITKDRVTTIIKRPDGTTETVIKEKEREVARPLKKQPEWIFTALAPIDNLKFDTENMIFMAQKQIIGPIYAGAWASGNGSFGLAVSIGF